MKLHDLQPNEGSKKRKKRVGRGIAAGQGKTAGRGTKGQQARQGGSHSQYFQGGSLPFFRRLPFKRGFTNIRRVEYNEVNLDNLSGFKAGADVPPDTRASAGLLRRPELPVVLLGRGELKTALKVKVHRVSASAAEKVLAAGGTVEALE